MSFKIKFMKKEFTDEAAEELYRRLRLEGKGVFAEIRNETIAEIESFLPDVAEILRIIHEVEKETKGHYDTTDIATAIHKRIKGVER